MSRLLFFVAISACSRNTEAPASREHELPQSALMSSVETGISKTPRGAPSVPMFAADVATDTLPLSLSLETLGRHSSVLIPRGATLPASVHESFTTAADNQTQVEVHLVLGEHRLATENRTVWRFALEPIARAPRGMPEIRVTLLVDKEGVLHVDATDGRTGRSQPISTLSQMPERLDRRTVDEMLRAGSHSAQ